MAAILKIKKLDWDLESKRACVQNFLIFLIYQRVCLLSWKHFPVSPSKMILLSLLSHLKKLEIILFVSSANIYESGSFVNRFCFSYSLFTLRPHIIVYNYKLLKCNFPKYETYRKNIDKTLNTEINIFFIQNLYLASSVRLLLQTSKLSLFNQIGLI